MDEELRTQVPLGSFHPPDAQSRPGNLGPSKSVSRNSGRSGLGFHCAIAQRMERNRRDEGLFLGLCVMIVCPGRLPRPDPDVRTVTLPCAAAGALSPLVSGPRPGPCTTRGRPSCRHVPGHRAPRGSHTPTGAGGPPLAPLAPAQPRPAPSALSATKDTSQDTVNWLLLYESAPGSASSF